MRCLALFLLLSSSGFAAAQVSGSVSLVSDYVYRGVSLSNGNPEPQASLDYDSDSGWFGGLFASRIDLSATSGQAVAYAGYAGRLTSDLSWEGGLSENAYLGNSGQDYTEAFLGLSSERVNARLYYSPDYLGQSLHSVYGEVNLNYPLSTAVRVIAHVGYLAVQQGAVAAPTNHGDVRLGLGTRLGDWNLQWALASLRQTSVDYYGNAHVAQHYTGILNASYGF
jgi:uncharacterized protein (TIGR02001 family)